MSSTGPDVLAVSDIRLSYQRGEDELFGGLTHSFAPGRITAVTGASGQGKSSLLYVLGLMLRPTTGEVSIDGVPVSRMPDAARSELRARLFGFVFQDSALDPTRTIVDAVVEPILYAGGRRSTGLARARVLLSAFGVEHRAHHRPGQISGGQAQRVALCRALANDPMVVLADEPTGNLDRDNAHAVLTALGDVAREGRTVVIATHDPFVVEHAQEVLDL